MQLLRLTLNRVSLSVVTLFMTSLVIFFMVEILPGDVASHILGRDATPESLAALRSRLHLNLPPLIRYLDWVRSLLEGDLGRSLASGASIAGILGPRIFNTVVLSIYALLLYVPATISVALLQATKRDRPADHFFSVITLVLLSMPEFLLGTILLVVFVIVIPVLPAMSIVDERSNFLQYLRAMTLPAATLAIVMSVYAVRMLRDNLVEVLESNYVRMAELKGLSVSRVLVRHALPNALIPTLNITALNLAYLIGGVVVVERVFGYPGFGSLLIDALVLRDLPLIEATVMIAALVYITSNLLADLGSIVLNPRLRTA